MLSYPALAVHALLGVALQTRHAEQVLTGRTLRHVLERELAVAALALDSLVRLHVLALVDRLRHFQIAHLSQSHV